MDALLADLIHQYLDTAQKVVQQMCRTHGISNLLSAWWSRKLPKRGHLTNKPGDYYDFHGVGCFFSLDNVRIDVDFVPGESAIGFDAWRLIRFARETLGSEKLDLKDLEEELAQLVKRGQLVRKGHLYFLPASK